MSKVTYTLLILFADPATVEFGAAGERDLRAGWYAYTGSAFGTGGFSRVERHRELAAGERDARHWHVDHLLGHSESQIVEVVKTAGEDVECEVSRELGETAACESVGGLGASDCDCDSHLRFSEDREALERAVRRAHESAGR
jgi:endonuclease-3